MAQFRDGNILDGTAEFICFASATIYKPQDIHGDKQLSPMQRMSALATALYDHNNKLPTLIAGLLTRAREAMREHGMMPFVYIQLDDGQGVSPFLVRRHVMDPIDNKLALQSVNAIYRRSSAEALHNQMRIYAIERPIDADRVFDRLIHTLPDNVIIYKEQRV